MILKKLTINNFQCFFGTKEILFHEGLNLLIGHGGKGKSKLFNSFNWLLFGRIYITDFGWAISDMLPGSANYLMKKHEIINKRALYLANPGEKVECTVIVEIEDDKKINGYSNIPNKIMRSQIQAHFIYNSLSAISTLIEIDQKKAQTALDEFTEYLRSYGQSDQIAQKLRAVIINLIEQGVDTFYVGNHGEFDILASRVACDLKTLYPNIQVIVVLCYPNELQYLRCAFTDFLMPSEIEMAPKRACIVKRNHWVADNSDYIVSYIKYKMGGAYTAIQYAQKHHKKIIEVEV